MIIFKDVSKKYGADTVLDKINFSIDKGSFVFLMGPTGSGKTTIFRLLIRDLFPSEGEITVGELSLKNLPKGKISTLRRKVGVIFQDLKLLMDRTVVENVMLPLEVSGMKSEEAKKKAEETLIEVGLVGMQNKFPLQLSGGERQRVAVARALVFDPEVILADEPTGNLDTQTSFQIVDLLESINKKGTTIFMATHNEKIIEKQEKRVIILEQGKILQDKMPKSTVNANNSGEGHKKEKHEKENVSIASEQGKEKIKHAS